MNTPSETAAPRGDRTREALVRAAIEVFGRQGFAAASTRAIAEAAGVNQALIGYHFGGKPGLYDAALEHITAAVQHRMRPIVSEIDAALGLGTGFDGESEAQAARDGPVDRAQHLNALHRLLDAFVVMLTSDESAPWARLVLREQQDPTPGFDILYDGVMHPLFGTVTQLIARACDTDPASEHARLLTITVLAQALIFRMARAAVTRQMQWAAIGPTELRAIQQRVRRNVTAILDEEYSR